ncbi:MAG: flap endonuclease-1 [Thermoplasmata archaeon]|nr:flap endonuclease-1 [Thermoplasmata archaeon]NIS11800.1 flap endonuclease-1 [Thermoplasmata archaeon]NIS19685.1 flap endonuclease-1 [Thermoplasmata archaeon]NIT76867.1 flap endonuclease-1 [Thermoplasmata archaeon]NIU48796.1 flap endonuclease-1 [Thermoplasmata archaeon]
MGINLRDVLVAHPEEDVGAFEGRVLALDAYNAIYQFLSSIRQPDGTPLMDAQGRVTSHLSGVLYRTSSIMAKGVRMVFVFDGPPHPLKMETLEARAEVKRKAKEAWDEALRAGDIEGARMKAQQTSKLDKAMVAEAKDLLDAMGIPWVDAPADGEAQASYMSASGDVWAVASQDYDSLLYGSSLLVRNATLSGRRKLPGRGRREYVQVVPERVDLEENLRAMGLTRDQLVDAAIMVGTDFNPGIKGVGPKTAIKLVKTHRDLDGALRAKQAEVENSDEIRSIFLEPQVTDDYSTVFQKVDEDAALRLLVDDHQFSESRVRAALRKLEVKAPESTQQRSLDAFF